MSALAVAAGPADRELDDLDLVAAVRAGDDRAFEVLFLRYQPRIAAYIGGMVRDHGRAEDIAQEVFMAALRGLREGDGREILFRPWIYEIAKNKCIDAYRRGRHTVEVSFDAHDQVGAAEHGRLAEPGATPDAAVEGKLAFDNLRGAFGGLSPVHHDILVMREFEGLSYRQIGERLGMSRPAVESTLFRARKRLGEEYEQLISGERCVRVQRLVDEQGSRASGVRDQRRVARHLAHCQPCRRHAHLAGADVLGHARPQRSIGARVAGFLPLPAFLRRRWSGSGDAGQVISQQAVRPGAQWSAHLAAALDPGAVSTWAKAAATAATVALAGIGGSAIEHRVAAGPSQARAAAAAASPAAVREPHAPAPRSVAAGLPLAAGRAADADPATPGASGAPAASDPDRATAQPAADPVASRPGADPSVAGPLATADDVSSAPPAPGAEAPPAVGSVLDAVGGSAGGLQAPSSGADDPAADEAPRRGRILGALSGTAPAAPAVPDAPEADVPPRGHGIVPARGVHAAPAPAPNAAPQVGAEHAIPPTDRGGSVRPSVSDLPTNPPAPRTSLGG
jgi:RNA polymerase sigma factor (sigma-70 family)